MSRFIRTNAEEVILYLAIALVGVIPVAIVVERHAIFGAEPTIGLLMLGVAVGGLIALWRVARKGRLRR